MSMGRIILVDQSEIPAHMAGGAVSWDLAPKGVPYEALCASLEPLKEHGVSLPVAASAAAVLLRVMQALYQDRKCLVKPIPDPSKTNQPTYAVLPRRDDLGRLAFVAEWSATVSAIMDQVTDEGGKVTEQLLGYNISLSSEAPESEQALIEDRFNDEILRLGTAEQSAWLTALVKGPFRGVSLPGGAGHFFVGPQEIRVWRALKPILAPWGVRLHEVPAMRSEQVMEAVIEGLKEHIAKEQEELEKDLVAFCSAKEEKGRRVQQRSVQNRQARVATALERIERYEKLFETKLDELRASMEVLKGGFGELGISQAC